MKKLLLFLLLFAVCRPAPAVEFRYVPNWPQTKGPEFQLGNMHGDVAVSAAGEIYVSVIEPGAGVQVFSPDGRLLRKLAGAPDDFHGFVIHREAAGEFIYGARLTAQTIVKLTLDGKQVMEIPASAIPDALKNPAPPAPGTTTSGALLLRMTGMDIAPNGDLYVTDGYASSNVHRFERTGKYLGSFGGKNPPYGFKTLHKIAIDPRFTPARIVACDRENLRVVHLSLDGQFLGVVASDLLRPSAVAVHGDLLAIGELRGRVTVLDRDNKIVAQLGPNPNTDEVATNKTDPTKWRAGIMNAAHGVAFNEHGDLFVSEWSLFGRMHRYNRQ